ncbi:beta-carotene 15,15'-monooxygenase [Halobacteriales archaeon QS_1_67_19]|nr:MAG: beta-carotene 15,15'-monooxygenase [Halobacteriales archaeon QS_1_67_19]
MAVTGRTASIGALARLGAVPVWVALAASAIPFAVGLEVPPRLRYLPFLASLVIFGLPHGAADHLAVARLKGRRPHLAVGAAYLVGGAAYLAVWAVAPALAFAGFILLTWYHWGQGDLYFLLALGGEHLRTRGQRLLALAVRGGIPMLVPLVAFPEVYRSVARATVSLFDPAVADAFAPAFHPPVRLGVGAALAALSVGSLALGYVRARATARGWSGWRTDAVETALLWAYFLVVPPVLAIGLYFCLWHSVRHVARLLAVNDGRSLRRARDVAPALVAFGRDALPNTVGALALLGGLAVVAPPTTELRSLLGLYLVLLAVLTLPHTAVVTWMDWREGVWSVA